MNREEIHRAILSRLLALRGDVVERVRLVARLFNDELLGVRSAARTYLFIPDLHLVSRAADEAYQYTFRKLESGRFIQRHVLLDRVCGAMLDFWNDLPQGRSLKAVQLGDFVDLWRENEFAQDDITGLAARILDDYPEARRRLVRRGTESLEPDILLGNHDLKMAESNELKRARRAFTYKVGTGRPILVTHGDLFDGLETLLDDELQEWFVERFGPGVPAQQYTLDRTLDRQDGQLGGSEGAAPIVLEQEDDDVGLPDWVNVWVTVAPSEEALLTQSHRLLPTALEYAGGLRSGQQPYLDNMGIAGALPDLRTIVIGHSHHARICIHRDREDPANNLVLADCGAWIENYRFEDQVVPSCQIGVLCGGDMRIYQLDPHENLYQEI
jgi:UDP-2,3-diacylglucosamine pyrophosphatase LpxH